MITQAYIHTYGNHTMEPEHRDIWQILTARGVPCHAFTTKALSRKQLTIDRNTLIAGDHPTIMGALKMLGIPYVNDSYPVSLRKYLKRKVWESSIRKLLIGRQEYTTTNIFIKPKSKAKVFNGFILHSEYDLYRLDGLAKDTALYCSAVVEWLSEYRVFVHQGAIAGIRHYSGDPSVPVDMTVVEQAVREFEASAERTDGYGIDFGVLNSGETALVEWNDGFALGAYGLEKERYTDLILARWEEIMRSIPAGHVIPPPSTTPPSR